MHPETGKSTNKNQNLKKKRKLIEIVWLPDIGTVEKQTNEKPPKKNWPLTVEQEYRS